MPASFTLQFFDLMVHLIPGTILLCTAAQVATARGLFDPAADLPGTPLLLILGAVAAFVVGFLVQITTTVAAGVLDRLFAWRGHTTYLNYLVNRNPALPAARPLAQKRLKLDTADTMSGMDFYRLAETIVEEAMPHNHLRASRVQALALFSRNLILVTPAVGLAIGLGIPDFSPITRTVLFGSSFLITGLFVHGWRVYWRRSIDVTLWAFTQWGRYPNLGNPTAVTPS